MLRKLPVLFLILLFASFIFLITYTALNWLWANNFSTSGSFPDQKYFSFGLRVNIAVALGYGVCTLVAGLLSVKQLPSNIYLKTFLGAFISAVSIAIYFFAFDFIPFPENAYFTVLSIFSMPILAIVTNIIFFRVFSKS